MDFFERMISKMTAPLRRQVRLMVGRGVINLVNDSLKEQGVQISMLNGEVREYERYQEYGFTSSPHSGAEGITVSLGGNRNHGIVIATGDRRYRLKGLAGGEVALYDDQGQKVHLKRGKEIEVSGCDTLLAKASVKVRFETPLLEVTGEIRADGNITDKVATSGSSMQDMRTVYDGHIHGENDNGGPTDPPNQAMG